jgi:hypothetical protein
VLDALDWTSQARNAFDWSRMEIEAYFAWLQTANFIVDYQTETEFHLQVLNERDV